MKKRFHIAINCLALLFFAAGCSKSNVDVVPPPGRTEATPYFVRFKVNGVQKEYKDNGDVMQGQMNSGPTSAGEWVGSMIGMKDPLVNQKNALGMITSSVQKTEPNKTYTNYTASGVTKLKLLILHYYNEAGDFYMSWADDFSTPLGTVADSRFAVTEATDKIMKGTFSGTLYSANQLATAVITEGSFYVSRVK